MPAPIVTLDTVEQAAIEVGTTAGGIAQKRFTRACAIDQIDVSDRGGLKSEALWVAAVAVEAAAAASPLHADRADMIPTRVFLEPTSDTQARGRILYELPEFGGGPPSTYFIRDANIRRSLQTNRMPGTHEPLVCTWTGNGTTVSSSSGGDAETRRPRTISDRITYTIMAPLRVMGIQALIYGRPISGIANLTYLNDATWPTGGSGYAPHSRGFWRLDKYETNYAKYSGYFTLDAEATSKVVEDWSDTGTLRDTQTGRYVHVEPADLTALLAPPYSYGITNGNGIQRVGFYPLISFPSIFGW